MYGAVCDDTVGFFAVLPQNEPDPPRISRALRIATRGRRRRIGVRVIAAEDRRAAAPRAAMRSKKRGGVDLEVPQPFVGNVRSSKAAFDPAVASQQQAAGFLRRARSAIRANFRERPPCNSKHHANIAIQ